ncbi:hypothetical protein PMAYCL1PPCAC_07197 [Pristionchus mayeri]|uniref:Uncharacterized protein n=1 Tax=Pristionchus mayeri TaxID=1317129 RepID=A0AAN4ZFP6_9BILA|nr:hypothetical protein PMAYCL1PPCAC_07197 [Pristionchus mayeri]
MGFWDQSSELSYYHPIDGDCIHSYRSFSLILPDLFPNLIKVGFPFDLVMRGSPPFITIGITASYESTSPIWYALSMGEARARVARRTKKRTINL